MQIKAAATTMQFVERVDLAKKITENNRKKARLESNLTLK